MKHIELKLWIFVIIVVVTVLIATSCQAQLDVTKRDVTVTRDLTIRDTTILDLINAHGGGTGDGDLKGAGTPADGQIGGFVSEDSIEGVAEITYDDDSLKVDKKLALKDSAYLDYIADGAIGWLMKTATGAVDTGTLVASKYSEDADYGYFDGDTLATRVYSRSVGGGTGSATPAGSTGSIQLNDGGVLGYDAQLNYTEDSLEVGNFYGFNGDHNTGVGLYGSSDGLSLEVNGGERIRVTNEYTYFENSGTQNFFVSDDELATVAASGGAIRNATPSSIIPSLLPRRSDTNTGLGSATSDQLSLISGGVEGLRIYPDSNSFKKPIRINALSGTTTRPAVITSAGQLGVGDDEEILHVTTLSITSANLLAGDSLSILTAPGAGKAYVVNKIALFYDYNSTTYASSSNSSIITYKTNGSTTSLLFTIADETFETTSDETYNDYPGGTYISRLDGGCGTNQPIWIDLATFITGNGTAKLKVWYTIADFN